MIITLFVTLSNNNNNNNSVLKDIVSHVGECRCSFLGGY